MSEHDVIVIGAGQNGLSAAAYLAKAGLDVVVLEKEERYGGNVITRELTQPGFKHDVCATGVSFAMTSPAILDDELELQSKYGLEIVPAPDPDTVNIFDDGYVLPIHASLDEMVEEIAKYSEHDAAQYRKFVETVAPMASMLAMGMHSPAPGYGALFAQLDSNPAGQEMMQVLFMSAYELATQWFEHPRTITLMLSFPSEAMVDPEDGGSALYVLSMLASIHAPGKVMGFPKGGIGALTDSLARCVEDHGGKVLCGKDVTEIITESNRAVGVRCADGDELRARKAVIPSVDPRLSLNKWLDVPLPGDINEKLDRMVNPSFSGEMVHLALDKDPDFIGGGLANTGTLLQLLPSKLEDFREYFFDIRLGRVPKPVRMLCVLQHRTDPSRAPEGKGVAYLWEFVPWRPEGASPEKWDELREEVAGNIVNRFLEFTTNMSEDDILGKYVLSPMDLARNNANIVDGGVLGPKPGLNQYMAFRPIPELGHYRTPVEGLYLAGQCTHPGGGVTLGGRAAVQTVFEDLGIDFDEVIG